MTWNIERKQHRVFSRNPLIAVVVDLRFHPILKIAERVPDFQECVRRNFPVFQETAGQVVSIQPFGAVDVRKEQLFHFKKSDGSAGLTLTTTSLTLDSRKHEAREAFISDARVGFDALGDIHGPLSPVRIGLRYINRIDQGQIGKDLGREVAWEEIVTERFLRVPSDLADLDGTLFACEVTSPLSTGGMTLRYGRLRDPADKIVKFRLDIDRYQEGSFDTQDIVGLLDSFSDDIFSVFVDAMGPALREWMEREGRA